MKKTFAAALAFLMTLSMASCGNFGRPDPKTVIRKNGDDDSSRTSLYDELFPTDEEESSQPEKEEISDSNDAKKIIQTVVHNMTLEEKVGQLFFARCPDVNAVESVSQYHLGGYVLFGQDFFNKTKEEIVSTIKSYQDASKIPMLIGTDEEGGDVVRVSDNMYLSDTPFDSPKNVYLNGGWEAIETTETKKVQLLKSLGVNVNLAPVCDVVSDPNAFMYSRSFSDNVSDVNTFVTKAVTIAGNNHVGSVLKHFPGYGNNTDTHTGVAVDERELSELEKTDLQPFKTGIEKGADCILVSHNIVNCMDNKYPASLSAAVHKYIRETMKFDGVVITDDLVMEAITQYTGSDSSAVFAVKNGNDMLCCSDLDTQYNAVLKAVKNSEITEEQIDKSVKRILLWKQKLGLIKSE